MSEALPRKEFRPDITKHLSATHRQRLGMLGIDRLGSPFLPLDEARHATWWRGRADAIGEVPVIIAVAPRRVPIIDMQARWFCGLLQPSRPELAERYDNIPAEAAEFEAACADDAVDLLHTLRTSTVPKTP